MKPIIIDILELNEVRQLYIQKPPGIIIGSIRIISVLSVIVLVMAVCVITKL